MKPLTGVGIVFLNNFAGPGLGGGEVHLLNVARACIGAGMDVHVVCEPGGALVEAARGIGATVAPYRLGKANVLRTSSRMRKYVRRNGIRIVHSGGVLANAIARRASRGLPVCVVTTVQVEAGAAAADGAGRRGVWLRRLIERSTRSRTDRFIAVSEAVARALVADGVPRDRVIVAHNGVRIADVQTGARGEMPPALRTGPGPLVGCVARLEPVKGADVFVRAAQVVAARRPDARFVLVGDGSQRAAIEALVSDLGMADRFALTGMLSPALPVVAGLDVVAVPSRSEGQSILAVEAMALGKPVVASDVGGLPEVVEDGVTGLLVPAGDHAALASAIVSLLDDPARAAAMGAAGLARAIDHFSLDDQLKRYLALFRELVAESCAHA